MVTWICASSAGRSLQIQGAADGHDAPVPDDMACRYVASDVELVLQRQLGERIAAAPVVA